METYCIKFVGRKVGAIGIFERHVRNIEAESTKEAVIKVYDTHEHLSDIWVNDIKLEHWETTTTNETKHTATPWKYVINIGPTKALICEQDGSTIFDVHNSARSSRFEHNIRQAIKAVNSHDKLKRDNAAMLETLKECLAFWDQPPNGPGGQTLRKVWLGKIKDNALAIIAQAEKESD